MTEVVTDHDRLSQLEKKVEYLTLAKNNANLTLQALVERVQIVEGENQSMKGRLRPDPRVATPNEFMREMLKKSMVELNNRLIRLEEQDGHHEVTRKMAVDLNERLKNLETAPEPSFEGIDKNLAKIYGEIHQHDGQLDSLGVNAAHSHDRLAGIEGRLDSLIKAVEGFAQKQEQQERMLEVQGELIDALCSWLSVDEYSLGLEERQLDPLEREQEKSAGLRKLVDTAAEEEGIDTDIQDKRGPAMPNLAEIQKACGDALTYGQGVLRHVPTEEYQARDREALVEEIHTHGQRPHKIVIYLD